MKVSTQLRKTENSTQSMEFRSGCRDKRVIGSTPQVKSEPTRNKADLSLGDPIKVAPDINNSDLP